VTSADVDREVETVNTRAGVEELHAELERFREQKQRARQVDRVEVSVPSTSASVRSCFLT
jgi:hypothetical protein